LIIEALVPMWLNTLEGRKDLKVGDQVNLTDKQAEKLLRKAKGKVRIVPEANDLHPGVWIEFLSPLFGLCTAKIQSVTLDGCTITDHSILKGEGEPVTIPAAWIRGLTMEPPA